MLKEDDKDLLKFAQESFNKKISTLKSVDTSKVKKEYSDLEGYIEQSHRSIMECQLKLPNVEQATQTAIKAKLHDSIPWEAIGYIDFDFNTHALDLKTGAKIPRKGVKVNHKRQISLYAKSRGEKVAKILYLSPKDYEFYSMYGEEIDVAFNELISIGHRLCDRMKAAVLMSRENGTPPKYEFARLANPNTNSWAWGDKEIACAAENKLWGMQKPDII